MVSAVGATTSSGSSNQSQITLLDKQLAKYEKELSADETSKNTTAAQLVATQITLVETGTDTRSVLGNSVDTTA